MGVASEGFGGAGGGSSSSGEVLPQKAPHFPRPRVVRAPRVRKPRPESPVTPFLRELGTRPDHQIAAAAGVSHVTVLKMRQRLGIPAFGHRARGSDRAPRYLAVAQRNGRLAHITLQADDRPGALLAAAEQLAARGEGEILTVSEGPVVADVDGPGRSSEQDGTADRQVRKRTR